MNHFSKLLLATGCAVILAGCTSKTLETTPATEAENTPQAEETAQTATTPPAEETTHATTTPQAEATPDNTKTPGNDAVKPTPSPKEKKTATTSQGKSSPEAKTGIKKAKQIALERAGLREKDGHWEKAKTDREDGRLVYDLEFVSGEMEYEFEIDAKNGKILEYQKESVYD